jgi:hypothetical protein
MNNLQQEISTNQKEPVQCTYWPMQIEQQLLISIPIHENMKV